MDERLFSDAAAFFITALIRGGELQISADRKALRNLFVDMAAVGGEGLIVVIALCSAHVKGEFDVRDLHLQAVEGDALGKRAIAQVEQGAA